MNLISFPYDTDSRSYSIYLLNFDYHLQVFYSHTLFYQIVVLEFGNLEQVVALNEHLAVGKDALDACAFHVLAYSISLYK